MTLSVEFPTEVDQVSFVDVYTGLIGSGSIDSVTVDDQDVTGTATTADATAGKVDVALENVGADESVTVTYSVTTEDSAEDGERVEFTGLSDPDVVAG